VETFDVAIVGGGIIGASIAFELAAEKLRVIVLDRQEPGREASWAAAGMLSPAPDSPRDIPLVPLGRESSLIYPEYIAAVEEASGKHTSYTREGTVEIFLTADGEGERDLSVAEHRRLGLAAEPISLDRARELEKSIGPAARAAAWLPREGTVEPRLLIDAVLDAAHRQGADLRSNCSVTGLLREGNRCVGVVAGGSKIVSRHVVLAAGCFSGTLASERDSLVCYAPTRPVRGQMIALRAGSFYLRRVLRSAKGYLVPRADGRIIVGSTSEEAGFANGVTLEGLRQVRNAAIEMCPAVAEAEVIETWSGLRPGTPDDLPILGPSGVDGLLIATGHYRNGILLAPITARLIREWIVDGRTHFSADAYSPMRFARAKTQAVRKAR
jgi:glycine oxidase